MEEFDFVEELNLQMHNDISIEVVYFAFTTLSTVGFGDFHPVSNEERIFASMFMLFGVTIFSYMMGIFIEILSEYQNLNADLDEGDKLTQFFGVIAKFNDGLPLTEEMKMKMEEYFAYKWSNDRNQAITEEADLEMMDQLPDHVQNNIFTKFLYVEFLITFN